MSEFQRYVLVGTAGVIVLMCLFPPFEWIGGYKIKENLGYSFVLAPPVAYKEYDNPENPTLLLRTYYGNVNTSRLYAQIVAAVVVGAILWYAVKGDWPKVRHSPAKRTPPPGYGATE